MQRVAAPLAHRLVGLERAVQDGLGAELSLDDHVRLGERLVHVAALVAAHLADELPGLRGLVGIEERLRDVPFHVDQVERRARLLDRVGGDRGDGLALVARLVGEGLEVAGPDRGSHTWSLERSRERDVLHARVRVRGARTAAWSIPGSRRSEV